MQLGIFRTLEKGKSVSGEQHSMYMAHALKCARQAFVCNEVPVGAVIISPGGNIISQAANQTIAKKSQTAHAELLALSQAGAVLGDWRMLGCWMYVTLQPCAMCMHALYLSRIAGVVYGADSPLYGFHLDKTAPFCVYKKGVVRIVSGIRGDEAAQLLHDFFLKKRKGSRSHGS